MRLPLAIATLFLASTTALPAFAAAPAPITVSLRDAAAIPIEAVEYRQQTPQRRTYRNGYNRSGYAAVPRYRNGYNNAWGGNGYGYPGANAWGSSGYGNPGGCVGGLSRGASSAFPSWDTCSGR